MYTSMFSSLVVTFFWGVSILAIFHLSHPERRFRIMVGTFFGSIPVWFVFSLGLHSFSYPESWLDPMTPDLLLGFVTHVMLFFLLVECYYHIDRSVTFSVLVTLLRHQPEGLDSPAIRARHDISETIEGRIETLRMNNYLIEDRNRLVLTPKGKLIAFITLASTWLFKSQLQKDRVE